MADPPAAPLWSRFRVAGPTDGGSVTIISRSGLSSTVSVSDPTAVRLDELQVDLGEGPRWAAFRARRPVLVADTREPGAHAAWPLFGAAVQPLPVRSLLAVPLTLGVLVVGVADLHTSRPDVTWAPPDVATAARVAAEIARPALELATRSASSARPLAPVAAAELRREVHQATGMLMVRLDVRAEDALLRLEAHAFAVGRPLVDVARDVLAGRLHLDTEPG